nr:nucleoside 2-deoxyribosyltransferase [Candidatus Woesearchaeota archaeon]
MKVYIAGPLFEKEHRKTLEQIDKLCKSLKIETYLPHRDTGIFKSGNSVPIFKKNRDMVDWCDLMIAVLDWKGISSGTAWEIGYAHAKNIPVIALVEDLKSIKKDYRICVMCLNSVKLIDNLSDLKKELVKRLG